MSCSTSKIKSLSTDREILKTKKAFKDRLPVLTPAQIRRHRIPFEEAIILELQEANLVEAVEYLKFLFELDEEMRKQAGPGTRIWKKPRLKENKEFLIELREVLSIFADVKIPAENRVASLMETAILIQNSGWDWFWISESLYRTSFWIAKEISDQKIHDEILAILRFTYGSFLYHKLKSAKDALDYVREAHQMAKQNKDWSVMPDSSGEQQSLYHCCCGLLHLVLMDIARDARDNTADVQLAIDTCKVAFGVAKEANNDEYIAESLMELGKSEFAAKDFTGAIHNFYSCLEIYEKISDQLSVCNVHSELAYSYMELGDDVKCLEHLQKMKESATINKLSYKVAEAHYLIGEFHLTRNNSAEATPNLQIASSMYTHLGAKHESNRARCLTGVSQGQIIMESYRKLILETIEGKPDALLRLILWRDRGEPFDDVTRKLAAIGTS